MTPETPPPPERREGLPGWAVALLIVAAIIVIGVGVCLAAIRV